MKDEEIGYMYDQNGELGEVIQNGQAAYDCIALSISVPSPLSRIASETKPTGDNSFQDREGYTPERIPVVNAMLVRREGGYCFRLGLMQSLPQEMD